MTTVYIAGYSSRSEHIEGQYAKAQAELEGAGFIVINGLSVKADIRSQGSTIALRANILCTIAGVDHRLVKIARALGLQIGTPNQIVSRAKVNPT